MLGTAGKCCLDDCHPTLQNTTAKGNENEKQNKKKKKNCPTPESEEPTVFKHTNNCLFRSSFSGSPSFSLIAWNVLP